jgi:hypothetical protein
MNDKPKRVVDLPHRADGARPDSLEAGKLYFHRRYEVSHFATDLVWKDSRGDVHAVHVDEDDTLEQAAKRMWAQANLCSDAAAMLEELTRS